MAELLKQELELRQVQKLSPLQMQTIKLLELPLQDLEMRVRKELEENPALDEVTGSEDDDPEASGPREVPLSEFKEDDPIPSYKLKVRNWGPDEKPEYDTFSVKESFSQSLAEQLSYHDLSEHEMSIALFIVGSLDGGGYLRRDTESLVDDLAFRAGIIATSEEVLRMLSLVQECEPAGVGARDLRECLMLQLKTKKQTPQVQLAYDILDTMFQEFSNKNFKKIISTKGIDESQLKEATKVILKLNPSPGGQIDDSYNDHAKQITPDFVLRYEDGIFDLDMPRFSIPELRINRHYADILADASVSNDPAKKQAAAFVKKKMDSAKCFVEAIRQRHNTLDKTMRAILEYQKEYFTDGDETKLRPMVLKDIAEKTGFDISTISRVANSKYIETHFGIYPLKYFFSEGLENKNGEEVSTRELKRALQECVDAEDKKNPLTDDQLVAEMDARGYKVARRTIAKYRDLLGIPKARMRVEI